MSIFTHSRSPQMLCSECGTGGSHDEVPNLTELRCFCRNCGSLLNNLSRDGVPIGVWGSLVDFEDAEGRVPRDADWDPT